MSASNGCVKTLKSAALVVFDLDGTLYDDRVYLAAADEALAKFLSVRVKISIREARGIIEAAVNPVRVGFLDRVCADLDLPIDIIPMMLSTMRQGRPDLTLHSWVVPLIESLHACGTTVWILTNGTIEQQQRKVELLGIAEKMPGVRIVFADEHGRKPAPAGLLHILTETRVAAANSVMVGNSEIDRECAEACGAHFMHVEQLVENLRVTRETREVVDFFGPPSEQPTE